MILNDIIKLLELTYPVVYQESYDNCGLIIGDEKMIVKGILICFDVTENSINEAIESNCNLIISHHPLIFSGIKKINNSSSRDRMIRTAIKNDIAVYALHTNLDNNKLGINQYVADLLMLQNTKILRPIENDLFKVVVYCPEDYAGTLRDAMFDAGAGNIGNYDSCSYNINGVGTFRANEFANPFVGNKNEIHFENEIRIETIATKLALNRVVKAITKNHPYEEVAYDIFPLKNSNANYGSGIIGNLIKPVVLTDFLKTLKEKINLSVVRHNASDKTNEIQRVAYCGGSGSFLINDAVSQKADIFITADIKYHDFFDNIDVIILADIGHFESEQFIQDILFDILTKKFPKFAILKTKKKSNPINYV